MKTEPKTKFTKDIVPKAISLLLALTDTLPVLILYIFTVLWYTVLNRAENYEIPQLELFWSFRKFLAGDPRLGIQIAENIILFMPFGFLLCGLFYKWNPTRITGPAAFSSSSSTTNDWAKRKSEASRLNRYGKWLLIPLLALSFSLLIESLQLTLVRGLAEVDDLFTNTLGAVLGICSYEVLRKLSERRTFEAILAIIRKNPLSDTERCDRHIFLTLSSAIRAVFVLICLIVLIFHQRRYPLKENKLTRSFCFQVDEASTQENVLTLRGFAFAYGRRHIKPRLFLRQTKAGNKIDMAVNLRQTKIEIQTNMDVDLRQTKTEDQINTDANLRQTTTDHQINMDVDLHKTKTGDSIVLDVNYGSARPDVNAYFLCDYDYTDVGFKATGIVNPETEYEIMIGWPLSKPVSTGVFITGNDVHRVAYEETYYEEMIETPIKESLNRTTEKGHPNNTDGEEILSESLEKESSSNTAVEDSHHKITETASPIDTDEEDILFGTTTEDNLADTTRFETPDLTTDFVKNGTLLVCRPDMHIWIFQYNGSLYWVADEGFHFEDDGLTYIQYHLWTTQTEKLPPGRLARNYFWNNLSGYFEKYEISGDFGKYRVMRCELPTEYSVISILTGYYKNETWVWANSFRPVYVF